MNYCSARLQTLPGLTGAQNVSRVDRRGSEQRVVSHERHLERFIFLEASRIYSRNA